SHKDRGWEKFTDAAIKALNDREKPVVFALWGAYAQKKAKLVTNPQHRIVKAAHPSPLSAAKFLGSKPYSAINAALQEVGEEPIDWRIREIEGAGKKTPKKKRCPPRPPSPRWGRGAALLAPLSAFGERGWG